VLPESEQEEADRVAERIHIVMAQDKEQPPLSASIGIPLSREGERIERLISEADEHLTQRRRSAAAASPLHSNSAGAPPLRLCLSFLSG